MPFTEVSVTIQSATTTRDGGGAPVRTWATASTARGRRHYKTPRAIEWGERGGAARDTVDAMFAFGKPFPVVTSANRIVESDGTTWSVTAVRQYVWTMQVDVQQV
jgi:hypothetical protein